MEEKENVQTFQEFQEEILKKRTKGKFKIRRSFGVYDVYKLIRKNKWYDIGRPLKEHEFYAIIRGVNDLLAKELINGTIVTFPYRMGCLMLTRNKVGVGYKDGKLKVTYPINWKKTLELWYQDKEAKNNKTLIRDEVPEMFKVVYNKHKADYNNKNFYAFTLNRSIKKALKEGIVNGTTDTFYEGYCNI